MRGASMIRFGFWKNHSSLGMQEEEQFWGMLRPIWDTEGLGELSKVALCPWDSEAHARGC